MTVERLWQIKSACFPKRTVSAAMAKGEPYPPEVTSWWIAGFERAIGNDLASLSEILAQSR